MSPVPPVKAIQRFRWQPHNAGLYPERWAVDSFPDDEQMAELRNGVVPAAGE